MSEMRKAEITARFGGGYRVIIRTQLGQRMTTKFTRTLEGAYRAASDWDAEVEEF